MFYFIIAVKQNAKITYTFRELWARNSCCQGSKKWNYIHGGAKFWAWKWRGNGIILSFIATLEGLCCSKTLNILSSISGEKLMASVTKVRTYSLPRSRVFLGISFSDSPKSFCSPVQVDPDSNLASWWWVPISDWLWPIFSSAVWDTSVDPVLYSELPGDSWRLGCLRTVTLIRPQIISSLNPKIIACNLCYLHWLPSLLLLKSSTDSLMFSTWNSISGVIYLGMSFPLLRLRKSWRIWFIFNRHLRRRNYYTNEYIRHLTWKLYAGCSRINVLRNFQVLEHDVSSNT